jgi:hypothetical protein
MEKALEKIDWESALRNANAWYDRQVAALRLKDRVSRTKELDKIENELMALQNDFVGLTNFLPSPLSTGARGAYRTDSYAITSCTTWPWTSVRRKSRPL